MIANLRDRPSLPRRGTALSAEGLPDAVAQTDFRRYLIAMSKKSYLSKITTKSQTVIPVAIRAKLGVGPGDQLRYVETEDGILIEKARVVEDDPFATFSEWAPEADEKAYADL